MEYHYLDETVQISNQSDGRNVTRSLDDKIHMNSQYEFPLFSNWKHWKQGFSGLI